MYASKHITGLAPNSRYDISYTVEFASSVEIDTTEMVTDTTGIGTDTPGVGSDTLGFVNVNDTVVIKAGATSEELVTEEDDLDFLQLVGIDVGEPGVDGDDLVVLGSFASDTTSNGFTLHTASTETPISIMTNGDGDLWLIVGAESFGIKTEIYINSIEVNIKKK